MKGRGRPIPEEFLDEVESHVGFEWTTNDQIWTRLGRGPVYSRMQTSLKRLQSQGRIEAKGGGRGRGRTKKYWRRPMDKKKVDCFLSVVISPEGGEEVKLSYEAAGDRVQVKGNAHPDELIAFSRMIESAQLILRTRAEKMDD